MNPIHKLNNEQIKFIEKATKEIIEDKEYSNEEINMYERKMIEYGMGESSKNGEMDKVMKLTAILNNL